MQSRLVGIITTLIPGNCPGDSCKWRMDVACIVCLPIAYQSDFIEHFAEEDIIALRVAEMFPEEEEGNNETEIPWDYSNEFK